MKGFSPRLAIVALLSGLAAPAAAYYDPMSYDQLLEAADLVAIGTVRSVGDDTADVELERVFVARGDAAGISPGDHIGVLKYTRSMCIPRWVLRYSPGQKSLFFIYRSPDRAWSVLGVGNEGLMPIADGFLFVSTDVTGVSDEWTIDGVTVTGDRLPLAPALDILERNKPPPTASVVVYRSDDHLEETVRIDVDRKRDVESITHTFRGHSVTWRGWDSVPVGNGDKMLFALRPGRYRVRVRSRACSTRLCPAVDVNAVVGPPVNLTITANRLLVELR